MVLQIMCKVSLITSICTVSAFSFTRNSIIIHRNLIAGCKLQQLCSMRGNPAQRNALMMSSVVEEGRNNTVASNLQEQSDDDEDSNTTHHPTHGDPIDTVLTEQQLQMRFQEAMQRRIKRQRHKAVDPSSDATTKDVGLPSNTTGEDTTIDESMPMLELQDTTLHATKQKMNAPPTRRIEDRKQNAEQQPARQKRTISAKQLTRDYSGNDYRNEYSWDNPLTDDDDGYKESEEYEDSDSFRSKQACEWETYRATSILFPPLPSGRPKAILHFVGGTFFGSYPKKFYGSLLEDIATKCEAVIVATPIPVILPGKSLVNRLEKWMFDEGGSRRDREKEGETNPLDHVYLAESVQREFNNAYRDVILDEYFGDFVDDPEVETFMRNTPIIGIGHSLGARIQAVSCSHPDVSNRYLSMGKGRRLIRSGRDGMIYLGFANWGASSSIPGLEQLERTVKKKEKAQQAEGQSRDRRREDGGVGRQDDVWAERSTRRRQGTRYDDMKRRYSRYDRYDAEDLDITDIFSDVVTGVAKGVHQISEALTPNANSLEFYPTPDELWEDLSPNGIYRKACQNNLIVQFDQDPIDQGSRLTRTLLAASNEDEATDQPSLDIKFARLQGGHLTPVTFQDEIAKFLPKGAMSLFSSSYDFILQQFDDERTGKSTQKQRQEAKDVADTVASYIKSLTENKKS
jgi:hypothetical protein